MALGDLVVYETGQVTAVRVLSSDAAGTKLQVDLQSSGTIRGVAENTLWTYTQTTRSDGSIYGQGQGVMTTQDGDVIHLIGHGSGQAPAPGGATKWSVMIHPHSTSAKYADLNSIGLVGNYDVAADGSTVFKALEWK